LSTTLIYLNILYDFLGGVNVSNVYIENNLTGILDNHTMDFLSGYQHFNGYWNYSINPLSVGTTILYKFYVNDSKDQWTTTNQLNFTVIEDTIPNIIEIIRTHSSSNQYDKVNILARIIDDFNVSHVFIETNETSSFGAYTPAH